MIANMASHNVTERLQAFQTFLTLLKKKTIAFFRSVTALIYFLVFVFLIGYFCNCRSPDRIFGLLRDALNDDVSSRTTTIV